jgi:rod shape determining protein RodA
VSADAAFAPGFSLRDAARRLDVRVLAPALLLSALGIASLASTRPDLVGTQLSGLAVGISMAVALTLLPYRAVMGGAWPVWIGSLLLLCVVLIPGVGHGAKGAHRWLRVGDVQFQPSEFAKAAHVLLLARYIRFRQDHKSLKGLFTPFVLTLVPALLIAREPDLGTALLFVPVLFVMLWVAGARTRHLGAVVALGIASLPLVYLTLRPYQLQRVHTFLPFLAPTGAGDAAAAARAHALDGGYQVEQSLTAIASGGLAGQGWGEGPMNLADRVPEDWTDFIFVVHAEEWGLLGVTLLVAAWAALLAGLAMLARECRDPAARLICVGALALLAVQASVNMMMTMGLAPVTGVPLPFLSYGRSAMLSAWLLVGLALHARAREPHVFTSSDFDT